MVEDNTFTRLIEIVDRRYEMPLPQSALNTKEFIINLHYLKIYLTAMLPIYHNIVAATAANEIRLNLYNENAFIRVFYLNFIAYLNFDKPNYTKHCLYVSEELEISEKEYNLAQAFTKDFKKQLLHHLHPFIKDAFLFNLDNFLKNDECRLSALLVLRYYPCVIAALLPLEYVFDYFLHLKIGDSEECISAVISCVGSFLRKYKISDLKKLKFEPWIKFLMESSCPTVALHRRLAVCDFLLENKAMYFSKEICFSSK